MSAPIIRYGSVALLASTTSIIIEFTPKASVLWKSTVVAAHRIIPQPTLVGGGVGANLGLLELQVDRTDIAEFRAHDTYYMVAGAPVFVLPLGSIQFNGVQTVRWILTSASANGFRGSSYFVGIDP